MRRFWTLSAVTLALTICAADLASSQGDKDKADKDKVSIEGTWNVTKVMFDGKDQSDFIKDKAFSLTFGKDNKLIGKEKDKVEEGKYKVDVSKKPMHIDLTKGGGKEETPGIFVVEGDTLTIGLGMPSINMPAKRPTSFDDKGIVVLTLSKQK